MATDCSVRAEWNPPIRARKVFLPGHYFTRPVHVRNPFGHRGLDGINPRGVFCDPHPSRRSACRPRMQQAVN